MLDEIPACAGMTHGDFKPDRSLRPVRFKMLLQILQFFQWKLFNQTTFDVFYL
jgi:hypothetical protein